MMQMACHIEMVHLSGRSASAADCDWTLANFFSIFARAERKSAPAKPFMPSSIWSLFLERSMEACPNSQPPISRRTAAAGRPVIHIISEALCHGDVASAEYSGVTASPGTMIENLKSLQNLKWGAEFENASLARLHYQHCMCLGDLQVST